MFKTDTKKPADSRLFCICKRPDLYNQARNQLSFTSFLLR